MWSRVNERIRGFIPGVEIIKSTEGWVKLINGFIDIVPANDLDSPTNGDPPLEFLLLPYHPFSVAYRVLLGFYAVA